MKLTLWVIRCNNDGSAYDIRATTKKEAIRLLAELKEIGVAADYEETVTRYTLEYQNGFDLLDNTAGQGGWECLVTDEKSYPINR